MSTNFVIAIENLLRSLGVCTEKINKENIPHHINEDGDMFWYHHGIRYEMINIPADYVEQLSTDFDDDDKDTNEYTHFPLHRDNGPAVIKMNGTKKWYKNGYLSRDEKEGPAIETKDGYQYYYQKGKKHRTNGPAVIRPDGSYEWWIDGKRDNPNGPAEYRENGCAIFYYRNNLFHRTDGPAFYLRDWEDDSVKEKWYIEGKLHRINGPAYIDDVCEKYFINGVIQKVIWIDGSYEHYKDGKLHSPHDNTPAVFFKTNLVVTSINYKRRYHQAMQKESRYSSMFKIGNKKMTNVRVPHIQFRNNGLLHRVGAPAVLYHDGREEWLQHGNKVKSHYQRMIQKLHFPEDIIGEIFSYLNQ